MLQLAQSQRKLRLFSSEESHTINTAIELLVRLEAMERGGGWLFRSWRRMRLVRQY